MDHPKDYSSMKTYLKLCIPLLLVTMACAFMQNMIFPPSPTPDTPVPPSPAGTATLALEVYTPTPETSNDGETIACDDDCLNACLDRLDTVLETQTLEPIGNEIYEEQDAEFDLVIYKVDGDKISDPQVLYVPSVYRKYQEDTEVHQRIWNFYIAVIPPELRSTIKTFIIFTDGPEETTAWVSRESPAEGYSQVGFDLLDASYPPLLADTLVHETAHLLTLSSAQVPYDEAHPHYYDEGRENFFECEQYVADGGCSLPTSYVNLFYQKFWKDSYAEWWQVNEKAQNTDTSDEYWELIEEFYDEHDDWFLNSYAATDVEEDMAESFAFFVLNPKPTARWIYEQKINFYYDFPELVEYRRQIIQGLCSYIE
jgi:hypothetical protein